jgi:hypothetical protein
VPYRVALDSGDDLVVTVGLCNRCQNEAYSEGCKQAEAEIERLNEELDHALLKLEALEEATGIGS